MRAVLPAWLTTRALVLGALVFAHATVNTFRPGNPGAALRVRQGLLGWDAGWYYAIALHGYRVTGLASLRFFPVFPIAGRYLGWVLGVGPGPALVGLANVGALGAMAALWLLVRNDLADQDLARRSIWLLALVPSAFTLVFGYADALLILSSVVTLYAARAGRWWWAALSGLIGGAVRPVGFLLVVPVVIELWQQRHGSDSHQGLVARFAAVLAPLAGSALYLAWVAHAFHDPWIPFRLQEAAGRTGGIASPLNAMRHDVTSALHGHHLGSALHVPWAMLCLVLLVLAFRRLPLSYAMFSAAVLLVSLATTNLDSFERYAMGAFPLVIAASTLTSRHAVEVAVLIIAGLVMTGYTVLALFNMVVP